jgi:hypothetical protein
MFIKYILGYVVTLFVIYFFNNSLVDLLSEKQTLIRFIELTLPLMVPSLMYFFQVNKDRQEREEKEKQKEDRYERDKEDKFEKSLPFFYVKNRIIFVRSPQNAPILNVKLQLWTTENSFCVLGEIHSEGAINSEKNVSVGGLVDGDEIDIDYLFEKNNLTDGISWFVVSATTITNDIICFIYLPCVKTGWHFYRKDFQKSKIVKYIGDNSYSELAEFIAMCVLKNESEFSYKETILNDAAACLEKDDLQGALAQLIVLVREIKNLKKCEILYVLHHAYLMIHQLEISQKIEPNYFKGNLLMECAFTDKYTKLLESNYQEFMMREYLYDIIQRVNSDEKVVLDFWLRNVEVYIQHQSYVLNKKALRVALKQVILPLVG